MSKREKANQKEASSWTTAPGKPNVEKVPEQKEQSVVVNSANRSM